MQASQKLINKRASSSKTPSKCEQAVDKASYPISASCSNLSSDWVEGGETLRFWVLAGVVRIGASVGEEIEFSMFVSNLITPPNFSLIQLLFLSHLGNGLLIITSTTSPVRQSL